MTDEFGTAGDSRESSIFDLYPMQGLRGALRHEVEAAPSMVRYGKRPRYQRRLVLRISRHYNDYLSSSETSAPRPLRRVFTVLAIYRCYSAAVAGANIMLCMQYALYSRLLNVRQPEVIRKMLKAQHDVLRARLVTILRDFEDEMPEIKFLAPLYGVVHALQNEAPPIDYREIAARIARKDELSPED